MQQRFLLQISLLAQHVLGTTMPIIRISRVLYSGCCLWYFVLWFSSCCSGVELRVVSGLQDAAASCKPDTVGILFPHINKDAWSKPHQMLYFFHWLNNTWNGNLLPCIMGFLHIFRTPWNKVVRWWSWLPQ